MFAIAAFAFAPVAEAVLCTTSTVGGNWNVPGDWSCGHVPLTTDDVAIDRNFTVNLATANVISVTMTAGILTQSSAFNVAGPLLIQGGTFNSTNTMTIGGVTTISAGTFNPTSASARTFASLVTISGGTWAGTTQPVTFRGGLTYSSGTFTAGTGVHTFNTAAQALNGTLAIPSMTVTGVTVTNNGDLTVATALVGTGGLTNAATRTLNIGGTSGITTMTATAGGNVVNYTGAGQTVKATSYATLNINGTATNSGTTAVATALGGAGTLTNGATGVLNLGGTSTITGLTATVAGNTVNYTGAAQTVKAVPYRNLTLSGSGVKTLTGVTTITGNLTLSGTASATSAADMAIGGTLVIGTGTSFTSANTNAVTGTTTVTGTGTLTNNATLTLTGVLGGTGRLTNALAASVLNLTATPTITTLTATAVGNQVNYTSAAAAQPIKVTTYDILNFSGAGTKSIGGVTTVNGAMSVTGGNVTNSSTLTVTGVLSGAGTLVNGAAASILNLAATPTITGLTATVAGNTVNYTGAAQTVKAVPYRNLTLSGSGVKTLTGVTTITGNLTLSGTASATSAADMAIGGTLVIGTGTSFTSANTNAVTGTTTVTGTGTLTNNATLTLTGVLGGTGRLTNALAASVLNLTATPTITTLTATAVGNQVNYTSAAAAQPIKVTTYDILNFSGAGTKSIGGVTTVNGAMSVTGGNVTNSSTLTVTGVLSGAGTLVNGAAASILNLAATPTITGLTATVAGNTVNYTGAAQTVKGVSYSNLTLSGSGVKTLTGVTTIGAGLTLSGTASATSAANMSIGGNLAIGTGTSFTSANANTVTGTTTVTGTGTLTNNATLTLTGVLGGTGTLNNALVASVLNLVATPTIATLTATTAGNTVNYTGAAQTIKATTYHHLGLSGSAAKTATGVLTVNGNFTLGGTATFTTGAFTHAFTGNWIMNTTAATPITATGSTINFNMPGTPAATSISGTTAATLTLAVVNVNNTSGFSFNRNVSSTTLTVGAGVTATNNNTLTATGVLGGATGTLVNGAAASILNLAATPAIGTLTATVAGNTVNYTGAAQTIKATTYHHLGLSGSLAKTAAGALTVNGNFTLGTTANFTTGAFTHNFLGNWTSTTTNLAPITAAGSTINFNTPGTPAATSISGTTAATLALAVVNVNNTSGFSFNRNVSSTTLTVGAGVTATNNNTLTATGVLGGATGTLVNGAAASILNLAATPAIGTLTATVAGNTVNYTGAAQTIKATTYHHLGLSGSLAKTAAGALTVNGNFTLGTTANFTTGAFTHNFLGNWTSTTTNLAPITAAGSTINFNTPGTPAATSISGTTAATLALAIVNINNTSGFNINRNVSASGNLTVAANVVLTPNPANVISGTGTLTGSGTVKVTKITAVAGFSQQYSIAGATLTNLTVEYAGTAAQTVSALTYGLLKVNNPNGVTLAGATTVSSTLTLTDGSITTSGFTFAVSGICPASVVPGSGYVNGAIRLNFPASATTTCTFPLGSSATTYTPIDMTATTGAGASNTLTGSSTAGEHPQIATSDIDPARSANRYWSLYAAGDTINMSSYGLTLNFVAVDVDGGATSTSFIVSKYNGSSWTSPTPVTANATSTTVGTAPGIAGPLNVATAFAIGEQTSIFVMSSPDGVAVVGGRPHRLRITRTKIDGVTPVTGYAGAKNLDGWYSAGGNHPGGATAPQMCIVNGTGTPCLPATGGSCVTLPNAVPALNAGSNNIALSFTNGVADYCLSTSDVGQYTLSLRDDSNIAQPVSASTVTLTARPFAVVVSGINQGGTLNPASSSPAGASLVAGTNFSATAAGYLWKSTGTGAAGLGDADADGVPDASPTYADVVTNGGGVAARYADTVTLSPDGALATNFAPTAPPATTGSLSGTTAIAVSGGSGSTTTLSYNEVGSFTLKATASGNYLSGGADLNPRVVIFADGATRSTWVGRFRPDHFAILAGSVTAGCGTFTYFGQDGFTTVFTITAQNSNNGTTANYEGSWAKLGLTTWTGFVFSPAPVLTGAVFEESTTAPSGTWAAGVATVSAKHKLGRPTALTGPTTITVSALPVDSDGVTLASASSVGLATLRYGRLRLLAAYGSERLPLRVPVRAEHFNGTAWQLNTADSCTSIPQNAVAASAGISANACFLSNPPPGTPTNASCLGGGSPILNLSSGAGTYILFDRTPVQVGFADLAINLGATGSASSCNASNPASAAGNLGWLQFPWCSGKVDPNARVKFGASKAPYIYLRERY